MIETGRGGTLLPPQHHHHLPAALSQTGERCWDVDPLFPLLLLADFFAVGHYNRHADWKLLVKLLPCIFMGAFNRTNYRQFVWHTITAQTAVFNLVAAPFIVLGIGGGIWVVKRISEKIYRILVLSSVILAAAVLVIKFFALPPA